MKEGNRHIDELIAKYLAGEALPEEAMELEDWKAASGANAEYFSGIQKAFLLTHGLQEEQAINKERMLDQIREQMQEKRVPAFELKRYFPSLRIAAAIGLIAAVMAIYYINRKDPQIIASGTQVLEHKLADGTDVTLERNSSLEMIGSFNKKERRMKLTGEANFQVVHDEHTPFIIEAGGVSVMDIGTAFRVKAHPSSDSVTVSVSEGVVQMFHSGDTLVLNAGESAVFVRSLHKLFKERSPEEQKGSVNARIFHFRESTLADVIAEIHRSYPEKIILENKQLEQCRITVDFVNEPIDVILFVIAETLKLDHEKTKEGFLLKGECRN